MIKQIQKYAYKQIRQEIARKSHKTNTEMQIGTPVI